MMLFCRFHCLKQAPMKYLTAHTGKICRYKGWQQLGTFYWNTLFPYLYLTGLCYLHLRLYRLCPPVSNSRNMHGFRAREKLPFAIGEVKCVSCCLPVVWNMCFNHKRLKMTVLHVRFKETILHFTIYNGIVMNQCLLCVPDSQCFKIVLIYNKNSLDDKQATVLKKMVC